MKVLKTSSPLQGLAAVLMSHPAVNDCLVTSMPVTGVGHLPRAYVSIKDGYQVRGFFVMTGVFNIRSGLDAGLRIW